MYKLMKVGISLQMLALLLGLAVAVTASHAAPPERQLTQAEMDTVMLWYQRVEVSENLKSRTMVFHIRPQDFEDLPEGGKSTWALLFDAHRQSIEVMLFYLSDSSPAVKFTEVYGRDGKLLNFKVVKEAQGISVVALTFEDRNSVSMRADQKYQLYSDAGAGPLYRIPKEVMIAVTLRVVHELDKRIKEEESLQAQ